MMREGMTIREAAELWVSGFNAIPYAICEKLMNSNCCELEEITPIGKGSRVSIYAGEYRDKWGDVIDITENDEGETVYTVDLDCGEGEVQVSEDEIEADRDGYLPMWGTLWSFGEGIDNWWLREDGGLQAMADCGFRIYAQEDYEYIFGIDGAGYSFYEAHWIPLYRARGLHWHDEATEKKGDEVG